MLAEAAAEVAERVLMPEADGDARGIGGKAQHEEAGAFASPAPPPRAAALGDLVENVSDLRGLAGIEARARRSRLARRRFVIGRRLEQRPDQGFLGRRRALRPEHGRGVGDLDAVAAARPQEVVERGGVGEGRRLGDGGVLALVLAVGSEGVEVEGDDRGAARLGAPHALDRGVQAGERRPLATDETKTRSTAPPRRATAPRARARLAARADSVARRQAERPGCCPAGRPAAGRAEALRRAR